MTTRVSRTPGKVLVKRRSSSYERRKKVTVDLVTGKEIVLVYFDPYCALDCNNNDNQWLGENLFQPARVIKEEENFVVVALQNGDIFKMPSDSIVRVTSQDDQGVDDILQLHDFSEKSLIHTLRVRYARDDIYTFVGPILISINPYKWYKDLYSEDIMAKYHLKESSEPHLFVLTENAYSNLMKSRSCPKAQDQSIIISGESGAGKTESTKVIMSYLARITIMDNESQAKNKNNATYSKVFATIGSLEQKVLNANPLLEAFGNAKTLRNDNSSRFGKFIKILFNNDGKIVGANIEKYLLEKTRVLHQSEGERNFHIFYQLLAGASPELKTRISLDGTIASYKYLSDDTQMDAEDENNFKTTLECIKSINIDEAMQFQLFSLLSGVLHLGNIQFEEKEKDHVETITAQTYSAYLTTARMLGVQAEDLLVSMTKQNMHVGGSTIVKAQTLQQAIDKRDSFAKQIYSLIFNWLVDRINSIITPDTKSFGFIGLLDIFGFENYMTNGFEQLLINYANEKLQCHFNKHVFLIEQMEYESENIDWSYISFNDNQSCVDLIDSKINGKTGVFQTLDDSSASGRLDVNGNFLAQLNQAWSTGGSCHNNYLVPRFNSDQIFGVQHYAGSVYYDVDGFAEKNRDSMNQDMKVLMSHSTNFMLKKIMEESIKMDNASGVVGASVQKKVVKKAATTPSKALSPRPGMHSKPSSTVSKLKEDSVSKQFTMSLKSLCETLDSTTPHYVRCLKPNSHKLPDLLNVKETLQQLKYSGMIETIRIRQEGYSFRQLHQDFFVRYHKLEPSSRTIKELIQKLSINLSVNNESWQVGTTKVFMKRNMSEKLDRLLCLLYSASSRKIQRHWKKKLYNKIATLIQCKVRVFIVRRKFEKMKRSTLKLQTCYRRYACLRNYVKILFQIIRIQKVIRGKFSRIVVRRLKNPYNRMNYQELTAALKIIEAEIEHAFESKSFHLCEELQAKIRDIEKARSKLPVPELIPTSRSELELALLEIKFHAEYAIEANDQLLCSQLETRKQKLMTYISKFPCVEEVSSTLEKSKLMLSSAMEKKDFRACSELQDKVTSLEQMLDDLKRDGIYLKPLPIESLKDQKHQLEIDMKCALDKKLFDLCASLQTQLDRVVACLQHRDLTPDAAFSKLRPLQDEFNGARIAKDFLRMAQIQIQIDDLTELASSSFIKKEENVVPTIESRAELEAKIRNQQMEIDSALQSKNYKLCDELNVDLETYKAKLASIPTAQTLAKRIKELEIELKTCINRKLYAKCEEIEKELISIKSQYEKIVSEEAQSSATPVSKAVTPKVLAPKIIAKKQAAVMSGETCIEDKENLNINLSPVRTKMVKPNNEVLKQNPLVTECDKPVSKLRPKAALIVSDDMTVLEVARVMSSKRADAALVVSNEEGLVGIVTDNDITRRVVAVSIDPFTTCVSDIMTATPKCVCNEDSALDALEMIVDNKFRHLPVLDKNGVVVGLLDIAKCLYEAISALEKVQGDGNDNQSTSSITNAMMDVMKKTGGNTNKAQMAMMQAMMESMFGGSVPTLRKIIGNEHFVSISSNSSVLEASKIMADARKGVLVMEDNILVGLFTPKDLLNRVVSLGLLPQDVIVSDVMTPNPDCVSPDLTLLDALKEMHDHKFLHLPVREDDGHVIGIVNVIELMCSTAGGDKAAGKGWRDFFSGAMANRGDDDRSETLSQRSNVVSIKAKKESVVSKSKNERPVAKLRPKKPIMISSGISIFEAAEIMASSRADAALITNQEGSLIGIITDNDITRRVISQYIDPSICVESVMTATPKCVCNEDSALDALEMMVDNKFRHLPVLDKNGVVVGLLDIAKCLYEAISALEKVQGDGNDNQSTSSITNAMMDVMKKTGGNTNKAQMAMMQAMMESMFGGSVPTLRKIIGDEHFIWVKPSSNVREASKIMADARKGVLVMEDDELIGILTPKDVLSRVLAKGKSPDLTAVSSVMTPNPDCVSADLTLLDALKEMHDHKYLHLPVRDEEGNVLGVVDVMELMCSTAGGDIGAGKGWRDFFQDAFDARKDDDKSETASQYSLQSSKLKSSKAPPPIKKYEDNCSDVFPIGGSGSQSTYNFDSAEFVFKVDDSKGNTHRIKCISDLFSKLKIEVAEKLGLNNDEFIIKYVDEENDMITMSSDSSLSDAVEYARAANKSSLKLIISIVNHNSTPNKQSKENIVSYLMTPFKKYNPTDHISESDFRRKKMMVTSGITFFTASVITGLIIYLRKR